MPLIIFKTGNLTLSDMVEKLLPEAEAQQYPIGKLFEEAALTVAIIEAIERNIPIAFDPLPFDPRPWPYSQRQKHQNP